MYNFTAGKRIGTTQNDLPMFKHGVIAIKGFSKFPMMVHRFRIEACCTASAATGWGWPKKMR